MEHLMADKAKDILGIMKVFSIDPLEVKNCSFPGHKGRDTGDSSIGFLEYTGDKNIYTIHSVHYCRQHRNVSILEIQKRLKDKIKGITGDKGTVLITKIKIDPESFPEKDILGKKVSTEKTTSILINKGNLGFLINISEESKNMTLKAVIDKIMNLEIEFDIAWEEF
ncbi:MAG: hypothetical protein APG08_00742 [Candidatus Methanofastidiosum methylothiophilum]|jgi:hypothetical protein|uniref:Uncharacterized protein n=1 Tax=Candidatus Methanofastidiosum methylothiophilum TaxID=1705564 RepID=A0A150JHE8_9EURY|nr:MAG: hypothetical protein AN188_00598 [Candidatus Methanofastidiosum methylthiophilus]MBP6932311.1 hypothetical protein [Methanofastidiosum sp.]OQC52661.1 MAG: hypothetical protein BWX56_00089 [Euryarchaeota archaeon ADurb.Bin023]KYC56601.1 MAG: hypothetical protein APG08_00742 [Candidatus Methanofastidiosum methylthiophilus]KYC58325.1 MAG: hypothetical protein APG09_00344 [Candidatus Methanofastidiosum methylthiophilus]